MRTAILSIALVAAVATTSFVSPPGHAQESITIVEGGPAAAGAPCGCKSAQTPPWHGSMRGADCGPYCPPGNVYHADPRGQLFMKYQVLHGHQGCVTLPPCFPRLHTLFAEGHLPTPRPIALPRCHQCGAVIEGGF